MDYTTQALIEAYLGRPLTTSELILLPSIIAVVNNYLDAELGGSYGGTTPSIRYYDTDSRFLDIDSCKSITSVAIVNDDETVAETYNANDYEARPRNKDIKTWIELRGRRFPCGVANIAISAIFTLGDTVPSDLAYLATFLAASMFNEVTTGSLKSESIEGYSRTFKDTITSNETVSLIFNNYTSQKVFL